jgi:hypothetical protein
MNCGSGFFSLYHRLEKILKENTMDAEQIFVNCYNLNLISKSKKVIFKVYFKIKTIWAGAEIRICSSVEPEEIFSAPQHCFDP